MKIILVSSLATACNAESLFCRLFYHKRGRLHMFNAFGDIILLAALILYKRAQSNITVPCILFLPLLEFHQVEFRNRLMGICSIISLF